MSAARPEVWNRAILLLFVAASLAAMLSLDPIGQEPGFHRFADQRTMLGVPNFMDISSNLGFLLVGLAGIAWLALRTAGMRVAWLTFFGGVAIVSAGSAYYHASPSNASLVWDRLPMTIAFMGLLAAVLGEYVSERLGRTILVPAVLLGFLSVLYWHWFDDLRFYAWIQLLPLVTVPVLMVLFRPRHTHQWLLLVAIGLYGLAKVSEIYDGEVFAFTRQLLSGHTLKHLVAALACFMVLVMLSRRNDRAPPAAA